jgi:hypothetical protein
LRRALRDDATLSCKYTPPIFFRAEGQLRSSVARCKHNETPLNMVLTSLTVRGRITPSRLCSDTHLLTVQHQATTSSCLGIQPHSEGSHSLVHAGCVLAPPQSPISPMAISTPTIHLWGARHLGGDPSHEAMVTALRAGRVRCAHLLPRQAQSVNVDGRVHVTHSSVLTRRVCVLAARIPDDSHRQ